MKNKIKEGEMKIKENWNWQRIEKEIITGNNEGKKRNK